MFLTGSWYLRWERWHAGASNGGTEAVNGLIELHRGIARGFRNRDNYRLRMLLVGGGLASLDLK
jgi:transposase